MNEFVLTEGVVAAIALDILVATAVAKSAAGSSALVGILTTAIVNIVAAFAAPFHKFLKQCHYSLASIVLSEKFLVLFLFLFEYFFSSFFEN